MSNRILFISHDASQTGAPILLFNLAKLLLEKTNYKIDFLLKRGGVFENEFRALGHVDILSVKPHGYTDKIIRKLQRMVLRAKLKRKIRKYDVVLSNTIINGDIHALLDGATVMTYVHELPFSIVAATTEKNIRNVLSHTQKFLFPSLAVRDNLAKEYHIQPQSLFYLPYYIIDHFSKKEEFHNKIRAQLRVTSEMFIVGCMGTPGWRKGSDVFLQVAKKTTKQNPLIKFVWCGGSPGTKDWLSMELEIKHLELADNVILIPSSDNSWQIMSSFDAFFLSSREDPYPLVVLEAAMMGLPVICFDKSGGSVEFVEKDCGYIVDFLDVDEAASSLLSLCDNKDLYTMFSETARKKYLQKHGKEEVLKVFTSIVGQ